MKDLYQPRKKGLAKIPKKIAKWLLKWLTCANTRALREHWDSLYGPFDETNYDSYIVKGLPTESGIYHGEIVRWIKDLKLRRVLLAGETRAAASELCSILDVGYVLTTGLKDVDYVWNYEDDPKRDMFGFEAVITQAMLEHLIDPYKHIKDLKTLLKPGGYIMLHTVMPGFPYHRHPIDAMRFFPDWFETVAERLDLKIVRKRINKTHIFYLYQRRG